MRMFALFGIFIVVVGIGVHVMDYLTRWRPDEHLRLVPRRRRRRRRGRRRRR